MLHSCVLRPGADRPRSGGRLAQYLLIAAQYLLIGATVLLIAIMAVSLN